MRRIGRYEIERELGRGAMGVVYLGFDPRVGRPVAIKTLHIPAGGPPGREAELRRRFVQEARAAGRLDHPSVVTVYDADEDPSTGEPFIAMEYVDGESLREHLGSAGPLEPDAAIEILASLAGALGAAHGAGIVHRDVKPANVLLHRDGRALLADFGVARVERSDLTGDGAMLGSPAYMAPEQVRGDRADERSDLFALAAVWYEALTGERAFGGSDLAAIAYAVAHETPIPPSRVRETLPPALDRWFDRALAKDPADRFERATDLLEAARDALGGDAAPDPSSTLVDTPATPPTAPDVPARRSRRRLVFGALAGVALLALASGLDRDAVLAIDCRAAVDGGRLEVRVDDEVVLARAFDRKTPKKGKKALRRWFGVGQESFETAIEIDPGVRTVHARLERPDDTPVEDSVVLDLEPGETREIKIVAGRGFGAPLSISPN